MARCGYCGEEGAEAHAEKCGERLGMRQDAAGLARAGVLRLAQEAATGREGVYGPPAQHFVDVATVWGAILDVKIEPWQVPACMAALKLLRLKAKPAHLDSWVDVAGYAALGAEVVAADE